MKYAFALLIFSIIISGCVNQQPTNQLNQMSNAGKIVQIIKIEPRIITIRNVGTATIEKSELNVYINDELSSCTWNATSIEPNKTMACMLSSPCFSGSLTVVAPGGTDTTSCTTA